MPRVFVRATSGAARKCPRINYDVDVILGPCESHMNIVARHPAVLSEPASGHVQFQRAYLGTHTTQLFQLARRNEYIPAHVLLGKLHFRRRFALLGRRHGIGKRIINNNNRPVNDSSAS